MIMWKNTDFISLICTVICSHSETEARFLQKKISSDAFRPHSCHCAAPAVTQPHSYNTKCFKRQRTSNSQSEEPHASSTRDSDKDIYSMVCASSHGDGSPAPLGDSPALFTPPYSPASSNSPQQREELSADFLMDVHERTDQLSSSPEGSPSYYTYPEAGPTHHPSPSDSLHAATEQTFGQGAFSMLSARSPAPSLSPTYDFQACTSNARLVPDCLSVSDMCESPVDCVLHQDDFPLFEQPQGGSSPAHHVPHHVLPTHSSLLTPNPSPTSQESFEYTEREQAEISILAQQISSLASSFDMCRTLSSLQNLPTEGHFSTCDWPQRPPLSTGLPTKCDPVLNDGPFESVLKDLDVFTRKGGVPGPGLVPYSYQEGFVCDRSVTQQSHREPASVPLTVSEDFLPTEQFTTGNIAMDPFSLQLGSHDQSTGLHQLSHYMQHSLQKGNLHLTIQPLY